MNVWSDSSQAQDDATLTAEPSETAVETGDSFTVSIRVVDAGRTTAWQAGLAYDPNVIRATETYTMGDFLEPVYPLPHAAFDHGTCMFAMAQLCPKGDCVEIAGDGELVEVGFTGIAEGVSPLALLEVLLVSPGSARQPSITWNDGVIRVGSVAGTEGPTDQSTRETPSERTPPSRDVSPATPTTAPVDSPTSAPSCPAAAAVALGLLGGALARRGGDD
jgi:hypothetical protein